MAANDGRHAAEIHTDQLNSIIARRTGWPYPNVQDIGQRLADAWDFTGAELPDLKPRYVTLLLFALAADVEASEAVSTARSLHTLTKRREPDASVDVTAGTQIEFMLSTLFTTTDSDLVDTLTRTEIDVCSATPRAIRVTLHAVDEMLLFTEPGKQDHVTWAGESIRTSCKIPGRVLLNIVSDIRHFWGLPILDDKVVA